MHFEGSGCRIGHESTKNHFWRSISRDTNMEFSALSPIIMLNVIYNIDSCKLKENNYCATEFAIAIYWQTVIAEFFCF